MLTITGPFTAADTLTFDTAAGARYYVAGGHITRQSDEPILAFPGGHITDRPLAVNPDGTLALRADEGEPLLFRLADESEPIRATRIRRFLRYVPAAILAARLVDADPLAYYGEPTPARWQDLLDDVDPVDFYGITQDDEDARIAHELMLEQVECDNCLDGILVKACHPAA